MTQISCSCIKTCSSHKMPNKILPKVRTTSYWDKESDHLKYKNKTAIGTILREGVCAADWSVLPVGSVIEINKKHYTVEDYGKALVINKYKMPIIDIYKPSKKQMNQWGVQYFNDVKIVKMGDYEKSARLLKDRLRWAHCRVMYDRIQTYL